MKKFLVILICVVAAANVWAGDDDGYIHVDWSPIYSDRVGWNFYTGGLVLGWNNACGIDGAMGRSIDIGWLSVIGTKYNTGHGQRITLGLGVDWRNYRLDGDHRIVDDGERLTIAAYPDGASSRLSRVKVFSLTVPLLVRQRIVKDIDILAGPVVNFNLHASALTQYKLGDEKVKASRSGIHQVPVTVDIMGGIKWKALGCYVRYSPCRVLKQDYAPSFTPLTVGIGLAL